MISNDLMDKVSCANFTTHAVYFRIVFLVAVIEKMGVPFTVQSVRVITERINDHHRVVFSLQQSPIPADFIHSLH